MNDALTSLVNDVYTLTNRPDLVGETLLAVRNATLKAHRSDFYYKDLFETGIQFDFNLAKQSLEYKAVIPRWRALKYLRQYYGDAATGRAGKFLTVITPDQVLDTYSITKEDVCYVAGMELHIRCVAATQYFLLGCYINPDVTVDKFSSWIADESPAAILYEAAATVFKLIGFDEQVAAYSRMVQEEYKLLQQSNIVATGE